MAVFPDRIVLKNSTDSQASIEAAIATGGTDEISQGEIVLGIENTQVKFYTKSGNGNIVTIGGTGGFGALSLGDLTDTDLSTALTDGQVLTYVAATGNWEPLGVGGYDDPLTTNGDIVIRSGGATTRLGIGTQGQVLRVSSGGLPEWAGGNLDSIVEDTTPQLGGDLDVNGFAVVSTGNTNISLAPAGLGSVVIEGNTEDGKIVLQSSSNAHAVSIYSPPDAAGATYDLVLPTSAGVSGQVLSTDGAGNLSWIAQPGGSGSSVFDLNDVEKVENTGTTTFVYNAGGCDTPTGDGSTWANGTAHTDTSTQALYLSNYDANGDDFRAAVTLKVANFGTPVPFWTSLTGTGSWTQHSSLDDPTLNSLRLDFNSGSFTECSRSLYVTLEDPAGGTPVLEPTANQALLWDATELAFLPGNVTTDLSASSIDALADVDTTTVAPTDGQALVWDNAASEWKPGTVASGTVDTSIQWTVTANGTSDYIFSGDGFAGTETDPELYVVRGQTYKIINSMGAHPFQIQSTQGLGGTAYQDGVTNNAVSNGTLTWEVRMDAPTTLYYQCTSHSLMSGTITVLDNAGSGNVVGAIDDLSDVDTSTTAPVDGQALLWDNTTSEWKPGDVVLSDVPAVIDDLNDVDTSTVAPEPGQVLAWDGSQWEPATPNAAGLPIASDGEALIYQNGEWVAGPVIGGVDYNSADPYYNSTELVINPEGANGSTSFTDESSNAAAISGNGEISTTQAKFGSASAYFDGSDQYLFVSNASWMSFGANAFTVEAWIWIDADSALDDDSNRTAAIVNTFPQAGAPTADEAWDFFVTGDGTTTGTGLQFRYQDNSAFDIDVSGSATVSQSAWHHVAAVRYNNTLSLYLDGTSIGSGNVSGQSISSVNGLNVGAFRFGSDVSDLNGYIDGVRVTTGVARYTGNFTPPTVAFPVGSTQVTIPYSIDKLDDVDTVTVAPTQGQALVWDNTAGQWQPGTIAGGATTIDGLGDVDTSTVAPVNGQVLKWNNTDSEWQPDDTSIQTASDFRYKDAVFRFDTLSNSTGNFGANYNGPGEAAAQSGTTIFYYEDADGNDLNDAWNPLLGTSVTVSVSTDGVNFTQVSRSLSLTTQWVAEGAYVFTGGNLFDPSTDSEVYISIASSGGDPIDDKDLLIWNNADQFFEPGKLAIDDLGDVDTSTVAPTDGQALLWDNTAQKWEPGTISGGGGTTLPTAQDGEALIWENGQWVAGPVIGGVDYTTNAGTDSNYTAPTGFAYWNDTFETEDTQRWGITNNDLTATVTGTGGRACHSAGSKNTGKWYWELELVNGVPNPLYQTIGIKTDTSAYSFSGNSGSGGIGFESDGGIRNDAGATVVSSVSTFVATDVLMFALDADNKKLWFGKNGTWDNSGDPASGTGEVASAWTASSPDWRFSVADETVGHSYTIGNSYIASTTTTIPYSIDKLDDVDTSTVAPTDGQALLWDAANSKWEPGTVSTSSSGGGGGVTTSTPWAPSDLTLSMWLDADDASTITESGGAVSAWNDKTANAFNVAQATAANQPTLTANGLNGKSVITFDGTNDYLSVPPSIQTQPMTIALVCKANSTAASGGGTGRAYVFDGSGSNVSGRSILALDGNNVGYPQIYAGSWVGNNTSTFDTNAHIFVLTFNGGSSSLKFDGGTAVTGNAGTQSLTNGVTLGANHAHTHDWFDGAIAEFIVLPAVYGDDQEKLEGYLAHKWGLEASLPAAHPYKSEAPVNTETTALPSGTADGEALIWENGAWAVGPVIGGVSYSIGAGAPVSNYTPPSGFSPWNDSLITGVQQSGGGTLSNNNLTYTAIGSNGEKIAGSASTKSTGKWYWEFVWDAGAGPLIGVSTNLNALLHTSSGTVVQLNGIWFNNLGGTTVNLTGTYSNGDVIGFAIDLDAQKMWIAQNGTWENSGDPVSGTGAVWSGWTGTPDLHFAMRLYIPGDAVSVGNYPSTGTTTTIPYSIDNLDDVDTSTVAPADGQALVWDSGASKWEPGNITFDSVTGGTFGSG